MMVRIFNVFIKAKKMHVIIKTQLSYGRNSFPGGTFYYAMILEKTTGISTCRDF
jgi:hypothetical protein